MKRLTYTLIAGAACGLLTSCDQAALDFAAKTNHLLQARSKAIATKIAAEKTAYQQFAFLAAQAHRDVIDSDIENQINAHSLGLAASYQRDPGLISQWRKDLATFGEADYAARIQLFTGDLDESAQYLQNFQALKIEQDKVDALAKLLAALSQKKSLISTLKDDVQFVEDAQQSYDARVCVDQKKKMTSADAKVKAAATALFAARGCADVLKEAAARCATLATAKNSPDARVKASATAEYTSQGCADISN